MGGLILEWFNQIEFDENQMFGKIDGQNISNIAERSINLPIRKHLGVEYGEIVIS